MCAKKLPPRNYEAEAAEADYWAKTDTSEIDTEPVTVEVSPSARTQMISIRLPVHLIAAIKSDAKRLGVPYQRLIRQRLQQPYELSRMIAREEEAVYGAEQHAGAPLSRIVQAQQARLDEQERRLQQLETLLPARPAAPPAGRRRGTR